MLREKINGQTPLEQRHTISRLLIDALAKSGLFSWVLHKLEDATDAGRQGDEKISFVYGALNIAEMPSLQSTRGCKTKPHTVTRKYLSSPTIMPPLGIYHLEFI